MPRGWWGCMWAPLWHSYPVINDAQGWIAALAAVAAAGVVAWQSWETRKSAGASQRAVDAANAALDLTRQQTAEAIRTRIDAGMPSITVLMDAEVDWPPLEPSGFGGGTPNQLPVGPASPAMHMPRDGNRQVMVRAGVTLCNESNRHVSVDLGGLIDDDGAPLPRQIVLPPGHSRKAWCAATHSLTEWTEVYRARAASESSGDAVVATIGYLDPADTGAIDNWDLTIGGTPVEPAHQLDGAWRLIETPRPLSGESAAMGVGVPLRRRRYFLSKSRNEELPD